MTSATSDKTLNLTLRFDRQLVWQQGDSVRYLVAEIKAENKPQAEGDRRPLNLALVIDASGSMHGPPLTAATRAALGVTEALENDDHLALVSFASETIVHLEATAMDTRGKSQARSVLNELVTRGSTDLAAGWMAGCECVAGEMAAQGKASGRVILLSDGRANRGIVAPGQLQEIADNLRRRGVFTSTVGIGDGYSEAQLEVIAEHGGGRLHDAERPEEIVEVVLGELDEVFAAVAEDIHLELKAPPDVEVECLGGYPVSRCEGKLIANVGGLMSGAKRQIVLKAKTPLGELGRTLAFCAKLSWAKVGQNDRTEGDSATAELKYVGGSENSAQPRDEALSLIVARIWQSDLIRKVVAWNRERDLKAAQAFLNAQLRWFQEYCLGLQGAEELVDQLQSAQRHGDQVWSARTQKEIHLQNYKEARGDRDLRTEKRKTWDKFLSE